MNITEFMSNDPEFSNQLSAFCDSIRESEKTRVTNNCMPDMQACNIEYFTLLMKYLNDSVKVSTVNIRMRKDTYDAILSSGEWISENRSWGQTHRTEMIVLHKKDIGDLRMIVYLTKTKNFAEITIREKGITISL